MLQGLSFPREPHLQFPWLPHSVFRSLPSNASRTLRRSPSQHGQERRWLCEQCSGCSTQASPGSAGRLSPVGKRAVAPRPRTSVSWQSCRARRRRAFHEACEGCPLLAGLCSAVLTRPLSTGFRVSASSSPGRGVVSVTLPAALGRLWLSLAKAWHHPRLPGQEQELKALCIHIS